MTASWAQLLWIVGTGGLVLLWARFLRRASAEPTPVPRPLAAGVVLLGTALAAGGAAAWGGLVADDGLRRAAVQAPADAPARARLFLRHVQLYLQGTPLHATVGYGPQADLRLPRDYGLDEAGKNRDVFTVEDVGPRALRVTPVAGATTRVLTVAIAGGADDTTAARKRLLAPGGRRCLPGVPDPGTPAGDPITFFVLLCDGDEPRALLGFERELGLRERPPGDTPLRVTPYVWRPGGFRPHHVHLEPGTLLQIGASADALPGVTVWEIPAPAGRPGLLFPPKNLLAPCSSWLDGSVADASPGGFFYPSLGVVQAAPEEASEGFACVLPFTPPFALEVRRLLPDSAGVWTRSFWAASLVALPVLCLLLLCTLERGSARSAAALARLGGLAVVAVSLSSLCVWRLLLAHRLDMMRDYEPAGTRVGANEVETVFLAAALAAAAVAVGLAPARARAGRIAAAALAWAAVLVVGAAAIWSEVTVGPGAAVQGAASLALGTAPAWWGVARARLRPWLSWPLAGLFVLGVVVALALAFAPRAVAVKLGAAWCLPPLAYLAIRERRLSAIAVLTDLLLLAALDTGVTVAIGGAGLLVALFALAGEALYTDADAGLLDGFARRYGPVVAWQALALLALALLVITWAAAGLLGGGRGSLLLPQTVTQAALHVLLPAALLFGATAALLWKRGERRGAGGWGAVAAVLLIGWAARGQAMDRVLRSDGEASARVAAIVDPAYALLSDERAFAKGLTAWRETAAPGVPVDAGAGFFGAQLLDPGVLLSIENDYLPVLLLRETGAGGLLRLSLWSIGLALALWLVGAGRFPAGSPAARARRIVAALLGLVCLYQPVASLGVLPLTGISWPGLGIDSPSDLWIFAALLLYLAVLGEPVPEPTRVPARSRRLVTGAAIALALAAVLVVARAGVWAMSRAEPVEQAGTTVKLAAPFAGLEPVLDYVYRMQCPPGPADGLPRPLLGQPDTPALERFQDDFVSSWTHDEAAARARLARVRAGDRAACSGGDGHWKYERHGAACQMTFKVGWPETRFTVSPEGVSCDVTVREEVLRAFRYPLRRPYAGARVRLVSHAVGDAAKDRGELVSGPVVVRLRPGAGLADATFARAGTLTAEKVTIGEDVEVVLEADGPKVRRAAGSRKEARLLVAGAPRVHQLEPSSRWETRILDPAGAPTPLAGLAVIVVGGSAGRNIWLFRPTADPLLADDVMTVLGSRRRHYVYGGLVPELGWVNPGLVDKSLGLDGWTHAAVARWERGRGGQAGGAGAQARYQKEACGLLAPPAPEPEGAEAAFARVCSPSLLDGVLECRVSLQPELETRLRHLLELSAQRPELFAKAGFRPSTNASFALLRGDTGEILAQAGFVPGRESTAYAPATPGLEKLLLAAREERKEESGAEKADWPQPIAVGSTMKPFLARAFERAAPQLARAMTLTASGKRAGCEPVLGHCPPTVTLWNHPERAGTMPSFLSHSLNWYQAALGLLGTALPDGEMGFGDGPPQPPSFPMAVERPSDPLWTRYGGRDVIKGSTIDTAALRTTPIWREFEALLGRPLCTGSKAACARAADRRDVCAARALPVEGATPDLRHLVALGPASFDFADDDKAAKPRQLVKDYLQLLRGSGKHPLASTLQLADTFNRLVFDAGGAPYKLAASWYPVAATGVAPPPCRRGGAADPTVAAGLCEAIADGTVAQLAPRLNDADLVFYGAKTGTIDSLGDIVENRAACEAWNRSHTVAGAASQPYHLDCKDGDRGDLNDSLLVLSFGVKQEGGTVIPLTLALRYQRAGTVGATGYAVYAADAFLDVIADYFD